MCWGEKGNKCLCLHQEQGPSPCVEARWELSNICPKQAGLDPGNMRLESKIPPELITAIEYCTSLSQNRLWKEIGGETDQGHWRVQQQVPHTRVKGRWPYTVSRSRLSASFQKPADTIPGDQQTASAEGASMRRHTIMLNTCHPSSWLKLSAIQARILSFGTCLSLLPCVGAAPVSKGLAGDIERGLGDWWQILLLFAPYVIILAGAGRTVWILRWPSPKFEGPVYSGAFAFASAFAWWAVRSMEAEGHTRTGSVVLAVFLACWTIFMAESRRPIREKTQYFLSSVFSGCVVSLLITAMVFIPTFEVTQKDKNAMAEYLLQTSNVGPIWLAICSFATYVWQRYRENQHARRPLSQLEEGAVRRGREDVSTSALDENSTQNSNGEEVHQRGSRRVAGEPEQPE